MNDFLSRIVNWLRVGYPDGVPDNDYVPLLALLRRRLTDDEVKLIARELDLRAEVDDADIGVAIIGVTDELPAEEDIERIREKLAAFGWPLERHEESE